MTRAALILAGGAGTRLRPLSSDENPKQFLPIFEGRSLLQKTYVRVSPRVAATYISTNEQYAAKCAEQLGKVNILTEPSRRNNGPSIALLHSPNHMITSSLWESSRRSRIPATAISSLDASWNRMSSPSIDSSKNLRARKRKRFCGLETTPGTPGSSFG